MKGKRLLRAERLCFGVESRAKQLGPSSVEGRRDVFELIEIDGKPTQKMLPEERASRNAKVLAYARVACVIFRRAERGVSAEQRREVVGLFGRRLLPERFEKSSDAVASLAAQHPLVAEIDGCVRV